LATSLAPVEIIDLVEEAPDSQIMEYTTPDSSAPIRRGERVGSRAYSTSLYLTCSPTLPEPRRIIIVEDGDSTPRENGPPPAVNPQIHPLLPVSPMETRLLPQILREGMKEPETPVTTTTRKRPLHSKPQAKRFKPNSRKGKRRIGNFVNLHLPFGYEPLPKVNLGTLDDALRRLGVET